MGFSPSSPRTDPPTGPSPSSGFRRRSIPLAASTPIPKGCCCSATNPHSTSACSIPARPTNVEYWAQVERVPSDAALARLASGLVIAGNRTLPCRVWLLEPQPELPPRIPPIPPAKDRARLLDWPRIGRRQEPPGPPHDRRHRSPHPAPRPRPNRRIHPRPTPPRRLAHPSRAGPQAGPWHEPPGPADRTHPVIPEKGRQVANGTPGRKLIAKGLRRPSNPPSPSPPTQDKTPGSSVPDQFPLALPSPPGEPRRPAMMSSDIRLIGRLGSREQKSRDSSRELEAIHRRGSLEARGSSVLRTVSLFAGGRAPARDPWNFIQRSPSSSERMAPASPLSWKPLPWPADSTPRAGRRTSDSTTRASHSELHRYLRVARGIARPRMVSSSAPRVSSMSPLKSSGSMQRSPERARPSAPTYGERPLHEQSHGESFLALLVNRFHGDGLYLLDEPEAALSPSRQLSVITRIHDLVQERSPVHHRHAFSHSHGLPPGVHLRVLTHRHRARRLRRNRALSHYARLPRQPGTNAARAA